ncbi:diacylglycerol kinase family protein [Arcticibacter sp. MXS-1]|uniref:diacylglycerol/lipid kinase family protein n=1 Tax=Arcticibacter sp. MXS-1 TaxID=3341726 RepID=UPI0035A94E30
MKVATLLHNPGAGDEAHSKDVLIRLIETEGYTCHYVPVKESGMDAVHPESQLIIIAGGDGTVRKVAKQLLLTDALDRPVPMAVLPLGTANNIARAMGFHTNPEETIRAWRTAEIKTVDIWEIDQLPGARFFAEGMGFGVFPMLIEEMKKHDEELSDEPEERIKKAIEKELEIVRSYQPFHCKIEADGRDLSGDYLLVELMNITSIGPNLHLAPDADAADRMADIVLLGDEHRAELIRYLENKLRGIEERFPFPTTKACRILLDCDTQFVHVDDELISLHEPREIMISSEGRKLQLLYARS